MSNKGDDKIFDVAMWSWIVGMITIVVYGLIEKAIESIQIEPFWVEVMLSALIYVILIFVSFIIIGLIYEKHSSKEE